MGLLMHGLQLLYRVMGIHLRSRQGRVSQQFFHRVDIGAGIGKMGGKRMAQHVGALLADGSDLVAGKRVPHHIVYILRVQWTPAARVHQQHAGFSTQFLIAQLPVGPDLRTEWPTHRHPPLLPAFPQHLYYLVAQVYILFLQAYQLRQADARVVQQVKNKTVGLAFQVVRKNKMGVRGRLRRMVFFQGLHALFINELRQAPAHLGRNNFAHGRLLHHALADGKFKKRLKGGNFAVNAFGGDGGFHQSGQPAPDVHMGNTGQRKAAIGKGNIILELLQVSTVGRNRVGCVSLFKTQIGLEAGNEILQFSQHKKIDDCKVTKTLQSSHILRWNYP